MISKMFFVLTYKDKKKHHRILFQSTREIRATYPGKKPFWYSIENLLYSKDEIYGWCCIGSSEQIDKLLDDIEHGESIAIDKKSYEIFKYVEIEKEENVPQENALTGIPSILSGHKMQYAYASSKEWISKVSAKCPLFLEKSFCDQITGYKVTSKEYGTVFPEGFWGEGELLNLLKSHIVKVTETLSPSVTFRGTGDLDSKKIDGFTGICKNFPKEWESIDLQFWTLDHSTMLKQITVRLEKGWTQWTSNFENVSPRGIFQVVHNGKIVGANKFYLLMDINIDIKMDGGGETFLDLYNRKRSSKKSEIQGNPLEGLNWNTEYSSKTTRLSDDLTDLLKYMGPSILIQDPYFIGKIEKEKGFTAGSKSFLNALLTNVVCYNLSDVKIIIDKKRLKLNQMEKEELEIKLKQIFTPLKSFGLNKLELCYAQSSFHDRYFLSLENEHVLYHVSKSISGYLESEDFNVYKYENDKKEQLLAQIYYRYEKAEKVVIVE